MHLHLHHSHILQLKTAMHRDPDSQQADDALSTNTGAVEEDDKKPSG